MRHGSESYVSIPPGVVMIRDADPGQPCLLTAFGEVGELGERSTQRYSDAHPRAVHLRAPDSGTAATDGGEQLGQRVLQVPFEPLSGLLVLASGDQVEQL